jgi:hypothetical protein
LRLFHPPSKLAFLASPSGNGETSITASDLLSFLAIAVKHSVSSKGDHLYFLMDSLSV